MHSFLSIRSARTSRDDDEEEGSMNGASCVHRLSIIIMIFLEVGRELKIMVNGQGQSRIFSVTNIE